MPQSGATDGWKRRAAESAVAAVEDGAVVGLGTGSTAAAAIRALGRRVDDGLDVRGVPTSHAARRVARDAGVPLTTLADAIPDVAIDGADQVADGDLLKGGGAAHTREKLVDVAAERFLVVVDASKRVDVLDGPVPLAVQAEAVPVVEDRVAELGGTPTVRAAERKDGPVVTDNGNLVVDADVGRIDDPQALAATLLGLPGVVEHGLFVGVADEIHVGTDEGVEVREA